MSKYRLIRPFVFAKVQNIWRAYGTGHGFLRSPKSKGRSTMLRYLVLISLTLALGVALALVALPFN